MTTQSKELENAHRQCAELNRELVLIGYERRMCSIDIADAVVSGLKPDETAVSNYIYWTSKQKNIRQQYNEWVNHRDRLIEQRNKGVA